jgi:outer membrane protein TolC
MLTRFRAARLLLWLLVPAALGAQTRVLTLEETLRIADEQSIDIQRARAAVERSARAVESARALFLPEVSATGDYAYHMQPQVLFFAPGTPFNETETTQSFMIGSRHSAGLAVNVVQPIYDPIRRMERAVAESDAGVSTAQLAMARSLVRMNAEKAFYRALYARSESSSREEQIKAAMSNLDVALARFSKGRAMALDTLTANVSVARARAEAERARYNYLAARLALAQILDLPNYRDLEVEGTLEVPTAPGPSGGDMVESAGTINSAELHVAEAERAAAESSVTLEGYRAYPTINAVGRWQALGESNSSIPSDMRFAMTSQVGLSAYYPIFNLWRGNAELEEAKIRVREADLEIARIRHEDSAHVESLLLAMQGLRAQIVAEEASVDEAGKAVDVTMILYKEGRASLLDVERAQSRVLDAALAGDRIKLEFMESYAELKALLDNNDER